MKRTIHLKESELKRMITESVRQVINELDWKTYQNAADKRYAQYWKTNDSNLYRKAEGLLNASDKAFNRDYGYEQLDTDNNGDWFHSERVSNGNGVLNIQNNKSVGYRPGFDTSNTYYPDYDRTYHRDGYQGKNRSADYARNYTRKGLNPRDFSKQGLDALNKAREEHDNYKNGNYEYVKGKGWNLKNK